MPPWIVRACVEKYVRACVGRKFEPSPFFIDDEARRRVHAVVVDRDEFELIVAIDAKGPRSARRS